MSEACTEIVYRFDFPNPPTHLELWRDYIHEHARRLGQDVQRLTYVALHWLRIMGIDSTPGEWKRAHTQRFVDARLAEGVKPTTIRRDMCLMQACLNHARKWERIEKVPHFEKPSGEGSKRRPLTEEEFARIMRQPMLGRVKRFFLLAYWTGHRSRAIEELTWDRVDFERRTLDFNVPGRRLHNKRRVSGFPIPDELLPRLEQWYALRKDDYVIGLGPRGKASTTYHAAKEVLRAAGINEAGICRHTLRKTFVTTRIVAGGNPEKVAALIADNPQTMRKHYSVLLAEDLRATANLRAA